MKTDTPTIREITIGNNIINVYSATFTIKENKFMIELIYDSNSPKNTYTIYSLHNKYIDKCDIDESIQTYTDRIFPDDNVDNDKFYSSRLYYYIDVFAIHNNDFDVTNKKFHICEIIRNKNIVVKYYTGRLINFRPNEYNANDYFIEVDGQCIKYSSNDYGHYNNTITKNECIITPTYDSLKNELDKYKNDASNRIIKSIQNIEKNMKDTIDNYNFLLNETQKMTI